MVFNIFILFNSFWWSLFTYYYMFKRRTQQRDFKTYMNRFLLLFIIIICMPQKKIKKEEKNRKRLCMYMCVYACESKFQIERFILLWVKDASKLFRNTDKFIFFILLSLLHLTILSVSYLLTYLLTYEVDEHSAKLDCSKYFLWLYILDFLIFI